MGRPREFDVDTALAAALNVFWEKGFEGASLTDLTDAMGITRPSLYAAYGNKEELFRKALGHYEGTCMAFLAPALAEPTGRQAVERVLYGFADAQTMGDHPKGCLTTHGALACSAAAEPIKRALIAQREANEVALRRRLERAIEEGDLPPEADPPRLARYVMTVAQGMSVQAASGATREVLHDIVATAMQAWPSRATRDDAQASDAGA